VRTVIDSGYWESFGGEREVKRMKEQFREMLKLGVIDLQQPSTINLLGFFVTVGKLKEGQRTVGKVIVKLSVMRERRNA
jgi:hypothetical protein